MLRLMDSVVTPGMDAISVRGGMGYVWSGAPSARWIRERNPVSGMSPGDEHA